VDGGGVDGGGVGVDAGAGSGAADTADLAALGQASAMVSETAADAITMIGPTPMRRTLMCPYCPLGSAGGEPFPIQACLPTRVLVASRRRAAPIALNAPAEIVTRNVFVKASRPAIRSKLD
jgi:hypothetical protein